MVLFLYNNILLTKKIIIIKNKSEVQEKFYFTIIMNIPMKKPVKQQSNIVLKI